MNVHISEQDFYLIMHGILVIWSILEVIKGLIGILKADLDLRVEYKQIRFTVYLYEGKAIFIGLLLIIHGCLIGFLVYLNHVRKFPGIVIDGGWIDYSITAYSILVLFIIFGVWGLGSLLILYIAGTISDRTTNY